MPSKEAAKTDFRLENFFLIIHVCLIIWLIFSGEQEDEFRGLVLRPKAISVRLFSALPMVYGTMRSNIVARTECDRCPLYRPLYSMTDTLRMCSRFNRDLFRNRFSPVRTGIIHVIATPRRYATLGTPKSTTWIVAAATCCNV
jgi:hypothetical protein